MDSGLKQRLIGAAVLIALAVIFLPMLVQGPAPDSGVSDLSLHVPSAPSGDYVTRDLPLVAPAATGSPGLLADDGSVATVDTATAQPAGEGVSDDAADLASGVETAPLQDAAGPAVQPLPAPMPMPAAGPDPADGASAAAAAREAAAAQARAAQVAAQTPEPARPEPAKPDPPKPDPVAAPARLPPATAGGDYAVNFGAYGSRADAGTVVTRLRQENLPAYVEETRVGGRDAWRVRIGPYATQAHAEAARVRAGGIGSRAQASVVALDAAAPASSTPAAASSARTPAARAPDSAASSASTPAAPAASAAAGTGFAVQLGAFGNAAEANALRDRLRGAGIGAFTETVQTDKGTLTRVKAGPVVTRAEADQLRSRVKSSVGIDGLVRSHP
ncbi:SPOR domain-containing protein [Luteimonas sp. MC1750]|uniref:SPOR domain-containing protein n=1 Tax=Luteimonas sp. MC1750 TaxID=2799326 RepID=UPI0018F0EA5E|nr:SPOR domain-containing protein [Luteimonas sp. MC1750]MBJ6983045.1 SPOR domain-containing protein [Luteimonas sp. MC1750]QQO05241.1 SPOR domain-containing protein [Luteimonas sp. MC1750]